MISSRLAKLERAIGDMNRVCRVCYGSPVATVYVENEMDPDGAGFRDTGLVVLDAQSATEVTDNLCCRTNSRRRDS